MGYNVSVYGPETQHEEFECLNCGTHIKRDVVVHHLSENHTSNMRKAWEDAGVVFIQGEADASYYIPRIEAALENFKKYPETYKAMEPSNGWGSLESATNFLTKILTACKEHPQAKVYTHF